MRVLVVHNTYQQPGGEDAVVRAEVAMLQAHGDAVDLHLVDNDGIRGPWRQAQTVLSAGYNTGARVELAERIRRFRPDVVHVHNTFPRLSPSVFDACMDEGVASVMTLHNFRVLCPTATLHHAGRNDERSVHGPSWWAAPSRVYRGSFVGSLAVAALVERHKRRGTWRDRVGRFIALNSFARAKFIEGGLPGERIVVKPNASPAQPDGAFGVPRVGAIFVGRLAEDKGVRTLVQAWRDVDVPLTIVGDGPLFDWARREAPANVRFTGRIDTAAVRAEMMAARVLILPSLWHEMFPMVIPEAFACGLPVVASDTASLRTLVQPGLTGALVPPGDAAALAAKVRELISDGPRLAQLGIDARALHAREFTPEANYGRLVAVYAQACAEGPRRLPARGGSRTASPAAHPRATPQAPPQATLAGASDLL